MKTKMNMNMKMKMEKGDHQRLRARKRLPRTRGQIMPYSYDWSTLEVSQAVLRQCIHS